jgi:hypothetical protein
MAPQQATDQAFDQAIAEIPSCGLDEAGIQEQRARYARLAPSVASLERQPEAVLVVFAEDIDRDTLEQALDVERACCPFFRFQFDASIRQLRVTVREAEQLPALDVIAHALRTTHRAAKD